MFVRATTCDHSIFMQVCCCCCCSPFVMEKNLLDESLVHVIHLIDKGINLIQHMKKWE